MAAVTLEEFRKKLAAGRSIPGITLCGADGFLRDECRRLLVEALVPEAARPWAVARLSARDASMDDLLQKARMLPMLAPRQVIFLTDAEAWQKAAGGEEGEAAPRGKVRPGEEQRESIADSLAAYLDDPAPFTVIVFEAAELDKRRRLFKLLEKHTLVVQCELGGGRDEDERRAQAVAACAAMLPGLARERGVELDREAALELAEITNGSLALAHTELEKLALYAGRGGRVTLDAVEKLVPSERRRSVWQFASILARRDRRRALEFLDSILREGDQPPAIVGAMAWMYRALLQAQELPPGTPLGVACGRLRMREETARVALDSARRIPRAQLTSGLRALLEADSRLKQSGKDERAVMEFLVAELTAAERFRSQDSGFRDRNSGQEKGATK
jgi:DNA polymerase-3 subunit delta